jgi:hypothetical protein
MVDTKQSFDLSPLAGEVLSNSRIMRTVRIPQEQTYCNVREYVSHSRIIAELYFEILS